MPVTCTTSALAEAAKCFTCLSPADHAAIQTYLLAVIAGGSTDPATLLASAKCFTCVPDGELKRIGVYLLCQAANGGEAPAGDCENLEGEGDPT